MNEENLLPFTNLDRLGTKLPQSPECGTEHVSPFDSNAPPATLDGWVETWCVLTRYAWRSLFSRWLSALCLQTDVPITAANEFCQDIDTNVPLARGVVDAFKSQCLSDENPDGRLKSRLVQLEKYLESIEKRKAFAAELLDHSPIESVSRVVVKLAEQCDINLPALLWGDTTPPTTKKACVESAIIWLIHDLAFWHRELMNEAGPWVRATNYHQDLLEDLEETSESFMNHASSIQISTGPFETLQSQLFIAYVKDEIGSLKHVIGAALRNARPVGDPSAEADNGIEADTKEQTAKHCLTAFARRFVEGRLQSSLRLLIEFRSLISYEEPTDALTEIFVPRLQWVFVIANSTYQPVEDELQIPADLPAQIQELLADGDGDSSDEFSELTFKNCRALQSRYGNLLNSWLAYRADMLRRTGESSECLSSPVRIISRPFRRLSFKPEIMSELSIRLRIGNSSLSDVFDPLHHELALYVGNRQYCRPWGRLTFDSDKGLVLLPSQA